MIDPDGMSATYNWDTGKYEDEGKEVSWDQVQKDMGLTKRIRSLKIKIRKNSRRQIHGIIV